MRLKLRISLKTNKNLIEMIKHMVSTFPGMSPVVRFFTLILSDVTLFCQFPCNVQHSCLRGVAISIIPCLSYLSSGNFFQLGESAITSLELNGTGDILYSAVGNSVKMVDLKT